MVQIPKLKLIIRYLDNQRDMAQELFDGNIASKMTLAECIVRGILPAPKYVTTVFRYQQQLDQYKQQILNIKNTAVRDINQQYFDVLRRALEQAEGLDVIFKKHITNKNGKYLVFCSDFEHLQEMKALTIDWFKAVNVNVNTYIAYSDNPETSKAFQKFKEDNSDALKLLFCIDMLGYMTGPEIYTNEGVGMVATAKTKGINGIILYTCYPFNSAKTSQRYLVFAKLIDGTILS